MSTDHNNNEWANVFGGGDKKVPSTPNVSPKKSAPATSEFESVFGSASPQAPANPAQPTGQADASESRQEAGLLSDEAAAMLKAKAAETGQRIVGGLGTSAKVATEKAKALRAQTAAGAGQVAARLRAVRLPKRGLMIASGGLSVLAVAALAFIYWPAHQPAVTAPAASSTSAAVAAPAVAASVAPVHAVAPVPVAAVPVPTPAAPAIAPPVTPAPSPASTSCTFDGQVVTADGTLISGATVALDAKGSFRAPVTTGSDGYFAFTNSSAGGVYALQVQAPGYRALRVGVAACATGRQVVLEPVAVAAAPVKVARVAEANPKPKPVKRVQSAPKADYGDQEAQMKAWFNTRKAAQGNASH
jgi:hypothetical protein